MYAQVEKLKANKSRAVANSAAQKKDNGKQDFGFVDNRPVANTILQLKTHINHNTTDFNTQSQALGNFTAGVGMQAVLDPSDPVTGSATSKATTIKMSNYCALYNPALQQTHLLNADLGGFGVYENLYPMTAKANREHSNKIERHVKNSLQKAANNFMYHDKMPVDEGTGIYYEVKVDGTHSRAGLNAGTNLLCEAYFIDDVGNSPTPNVNKKIVIAQIKSEPQTDNTEAEPFALPWGVVLNWWDHKQGEVNPDASEKQKEFISKREGKADLATKFSKYTDGKTWDDYRKSKISVNSDLLNNKLEILQSIVWKNYETAKLLGMERFQNDIYTSRLDKIIGKIKNTPNHIILNFFEFKKVKSDVTEDERITFEKIRTDDEAFWRSFEEETIEEGDEDMM